MVSGEGERVGFQSEIEPLLINIRTEAAERYERYLADIPDKAPNVELWAKDQQEFHGMVEDLLLRFREFYVLDSHDFATNVAQLSTPLEEKQRPLVSRPVHGTAFASVFSADANFMRDVAEMIHTEQWNSRAATSFRDNFLKPFETAADWQGAYIRELAVAAQAYRDTVDKTKEGLKFVAESCLGALRYRPLYQAGSEDLRANLGAVSLLTAALALFLPASTPALVVGGISLTSGIASVPPPEKKPYLQVDHSEFPHSIIRNTEYAIKELHEMVLDVDETLARGLAADLDSTDAFASPQLRLPPPGINSDTYGQLDIKDGDGKPPNQVVVSVVQLGRAGVYNLPGAAREYDLALAKINACQIPGGLSRFFPRSIPPFNTACGQLASVLAQTRDDLNEAGEAMLTAARTYQATDEEQAQILREISQIPPHHSTAPVH